MRVEIRGYGYEGELLTEIFYMEGDIDEIRGAVKYFAISNEVAEVRVYEDITDHLYPKDTDDEEEQIINQELAYSENDDLEDWRGYDPYIDEEYQ